MGRFNAYQSDLKYEPQSFEKMAMLPMQLRKTQDAAEADANLVELNAANTKVSAGYQEAYDKQKQAFDNKAADISARLAKEGSGNPALMQEFTNLKRQYNLAASATGVFGAGAKRFKDEAEAEKAYTEYGITKAGQGYESVSAAWKEKMAGENEAIRKGLSENSNFVAKEMVHEYAPNKFDLGDFALKMKGVIGMSGGSSSEDLVAGLTKDPATGQMSINTDSSAWKNNKEQLMQFAQLAKSNLFDPTSDLNKHLRYNKRSLKDYLGDIDNYVGMMQTDQFDKANSIKPFGSGTQNESDGNGADPNKKGVEVVARTERGEQSNIQIPGLNGGVLTRVSERTVKNLEAQMEIMERRGDEVINTPEYATAKQVVVDKGNNVRKWEQVNVKKLDQAAIKEGFKSYDDFNKQRAHIANEKGRLLGVNNWDEDASKFAQRAVDETIKNTEDIRDRIRKSTGVEDQMFNQVIYGAGFSDETDEKYKKMTAALNNSTAFFNDQIGKNSFVYDIDEDGRQNLSESQSINAGAANKIKVVSFSSKNIKGAPSVGIDFTFGEGVNVKVKHLDLEVGFDNKSISRNVIQDMKDSSNDPETIYILDSILDSASASQVIPDSTKYKAKGNNNSGASKAQSNMIIAFNSAASNKPGSGTINNTGSYQLLSEGPHYSLNVRQKGDSDYHIYNIGDLITDRATAKDPRISQNAKNAEVQALVKLLKYNKIAGTKSFEKDTNPIVPEDSGSKRISLSLELDKYIEATSKLNLTTAERDVATNEFIEKTSAIGLKSMNKAAFLKH